MSAIDARLFQTGYSGLTASDIASFLKRTFSVSESALATLLIAQVEADFARACNRNFKIDDGASSYTLVEYYEFFNGGASRFMTRNLPMNSLVKIEVDGVDKTEHYTENQNYWIYDSYIEFANIVVGTGYRNRAVKLTYTLRQFWGDDVKLFLRKWIAFEFLKSENAGVSISRMSFADMSQDFDLKSFEKEKERMIGRYINFNI